MSERTPEEISLMLAEEIRDFRREVQPVIERTEQDRQMLAELGFAVRSLDQKIDLLVPIVRGNGKPSLEVRLASLETVTLSNAKKINETAEAVRKHSSAISFLQGSWKVICIVGGIVALAISAYVGMRK